MDGILPTWDGILGVLISAFCIYVMIIVLTRFGGLRSFSKASSFDFAMTVAIGSVVASSILNGSPPLLQALFALALLYGLQIGVGVLRQRWRPVQRLVDNEPRLLMAGPVILHEHMRAAQITEDDLRAKLREAGVHSYSDVQAVVLETTGDFSVLAGPDPPDADLFTHVIGAERLRER